MVNNVSWTDLAKEDERTSTRLWQDRDNVKKTQEEKQEKKLKELALKVR